MTLWLHESGKNVLAIDADHNMDLSFNLTAGSLPGDIRYLGSALDDALRYVDLGLEDHYSDAFLRRTLARFIG